MNIKITRVVFTMALLFVTSCEGDLTTQKKPVSHPFLCADYGANMVRIVSREGQVVWEYPADQPQDVWQLPNGNILFTHLRGVKEVTRDKEVVWQYQVEKPNEVHACQPLPDDLCLIAVSGPCELLEVDRSGTVVRNVKLTTGQKNTHAQMRMARKLANGRYLVGHNSDGVVREYDASGTLLRTFEVEGNPYGGIRLAKGNTAIACGDGHKLIEVDADGKVVWQLNENDLEGNPLRFVAGLQRLANGNTVVCNWGGHGHVGEQPQVFEVTPDKKVVWQVYDFAKFSTISSIQLLDVKGDVTRGEVLR